MEPDADLASALIKKKVPETTYHERASAPAPSTNDIHPISHEEFAAKGRRRKDCDKITTTYRLQKIKCS